MKKLFGFRNYIKDLIMSGNSETDTDSFNWRKIIDISKNVWSNALDLSKSGIPVLVATSLGGYNQGAVVESVLAVALTLRGANVEILLCDQFLPACQLTKIQKISPSELTFHGQQRLCNLCFKSGLTIYSDLKLPILRYSHFVNSSHRDRAEKISRAVKFNDLKNYRFNGCAVGEHALAGCLRYYARGDLKTEDYGEPILRKYLNAAILSVMAMENILSNKKYDVVCFHHGIYVPQGLIGEMCRKKGIRVVNWNPAYRKNCFIFSHKDSYHHTMISEPTSAWKNIPWSVHSEKKIDKYLKNRWKGTYDWIWFHKTPKLKLSDISKESGIDFNKHSIGMLTNVMWDAQLHYPSNAFSNMLDWVIQTINYFKKRQDLQLIIRVHPAEITGAIPSRQLLTDEIKILFPKLPKNVYIIPPGSHISTYALMQQCDSILIYNTKTGIELSSMGLPVIVAGEAWIRGKGFSIDVNSPSDYFKLLNRLPLQKKLSETQLLLAKKYAFHFFFRRMIALPFITNPKRFEFGINIATLQDLSKDQVKGLDIICDGILHGTPFIYPAEKENYN